MFANISQLLERNISLEVAFVDLDRHLGGRIGGISEYIGRHGYDADARENVETYCSLFGGDIRPGVVALSSGFMTYARDIHPGYSRVRRELERTGWPIDVKDCFVLTLAA